MAERMMNKIHVLLVEHDMNSCAQTVAVLEYFSYIVTPVQLASQAAALICEGVHPFDMLIQNINSPDAHGYMLITEAVKMQLPVILLVDEEDTVLTKTVLEGGVFLCVRRPVSPDMAKYLWQYAARETFTRFFQDPSMGYRENGGHRLENHDEGEGVRYVQDGSSFCCRKKVWTEWTQELHDKFMEAVVMLGEGRCYPKDILDLMKVPGLTRMQVASHLQKCRTGSWQPPNGRRTRATRQKSASTSGRSRRNRFGCMPNASNNDSNRTPAQTQQNDNTQFPMNHHPVPEPEPEPNMGIGDKEGEWRSQLQEGMIHLEPQDQTEYNPMMNHVAVEAFNTAHYDLGLGYSEAQGGQQMQMQLDESFAYPTLDYSMQRIQYSESTQGMDLDQQYFNQQPPPGLYPF